MSIPNNPSGRLLQVLQEVVPGNEQQRMTEVWRAALGVEEGDDAALFIRIGKLGRLTDIIEARVRKLDGVVVRDPDRHVHHLNDIRAAILNYRGTRKQLSAVMQQAKWDQLASIDDMLSLHSPDVVIPDKDLQELRDLIDEGELALGSADLLPEHAEQLERRLRALREAVDAVRFFGPEAVFDEADATLGLFSRMRLKYGSDLWDRPGLKTFAAIVGRILAHKLGAEIVDQLELPWREVKALPRPRE